MFPAFTSTSQVNPGVNIGLGLAGAIIGGTAGYFITGWVARQGFYAMLLPGVLLGMGCGGLIRRRSVPLAVFCGVLALGLGVFTEWSNFPFVKDSSWKFFMQHVPQLPPVRLLMIALGGLGGFWFALGKAAHSQ